MRETEETTTELWGSCLEAECRLANQFSPINLLVQTDRHRDADGARNRPRCHGASKSGLQQKAGQTLSTYTGS